MTAYEIIDFICDSVNPILFFVAIFLALAELTKRNFKASAVALSFLFASLGLVYGILFIDNKIKIWESFGSDYSTHTAFAIAVCVSISVIKKWNKWLLFVILLYALAMLYQRYHTILDIFSTSVIVAIPLVISRKFLKKLL